MHSTCMLSAILLSVTLASACSSSKPVTGVKPQMLGTWRFSERVSQDLLLEGHFTVEPDTVDIDATPGPCRYERDRSNALSIAYSCGGDVMFAFDRADPVRRATYSALIHLAETRSVCQRYVTNKNGQTVCAEYGKEVVYRDVHRSGLLRVERMEAER